MPSPFAEPNWAGGLLKSVLVGQMTLAANYPLHRLAPLKPGAGWTSNSSVVSILIGLASALAQNG